MKGHNTIIPAAIRGRYAGEGKIIQRLEVRPNMCTNTLTGVQKDNVLIEIDESEEANVKTHFRVRKLTQKECWRLMGFSDEDFYKAQVAMNQNLYGGKDRSGSQLYKQAGNSIVVDVLCAIMKELYEAMPYLFDDMVVGSFFSGIGAFEKALSTFDIPILSDQLNDIVKGDALHQIGYINDYNGDANRVYDSETVARALKAEAGGGGAKTGWYATRKQTPTT